MRNKAKVFFFIATIGLIFLVFLINQNVFIDKQETFSQSTDSREDLNLKKPLTSKYWDNFTFIHINGNWSIAASYGWCRGNGSLGNPYTIENITIDASSSPTESGIFIENSKNDYFTIRNCTVFNVPPIENAAGIKLKNVNNGTLTNNYCCNNGGYGILLLGTSTQKCENNVIIDNIANNNYLGIVLRDYCNYNNISGNTANNNRYAGVYIYNSNYNIITGNTANNNKLPGWSTLYGSGIKLTDSYYNLVTKNECNNNNNGIDVLDSDLNNFTDNIANYNVRGICLETSNNNMILNNQFLEDQYPILQFNCEGNVFEGNSISTPSDDDDDDDKGKEEAIPGYDILFIVGLINIIFIILIKKNKKKITN